jgi:hypothetical protein
VLGLSGLALGGLVLEGLKRVENRWKQDRHAMLSLTVGTGGPTEEDLTSRLQAGGYSVVVCHHQRIGSHAAPQQPIRKDKPDESRIHAHDSGRTKALHDRCGRQQDQCARERAEQ